ncbi:MAG: S1 RNA-binding domain-containing protein [Actinobacteria bacterium]|nr:S1 RNA-binding domain-containing protein [Actinomycetota bacterium]
MIQQGDIIEGTVVRLEEYGAFIDIPVAEGSDRTVTGLCHVSEVDLNFVDNIYAYLTEGEKVEVRIIAIKDDGKVDLSIRQADPEFEDIPEPPRRNRLDRDFDKRLRRFMHSSQMIQGEARRQRESKR